MDKYKDPRKIFVICHETGWQQCDICERADCGDNTNPDVKKQDRDKQEAGPMDVLVEKLFKGLCQTYGLATMTSAKALARITYDHFVDEAVASGEFVMTELDKQMRNAGWVERTMEWVRAAARRDQLAAVAASCTQDAKRIAELSERLRVARLDGTAVVKDLRQQVERLSEDLRYETSRRVHAEAESASRQCGNEQLAGLCRQIRAEADANATAARELAELREVITSASTLRELLKTPKPKCSYCNDTGFADPALSADSTVGCPVCHTQPQVVKPKISVQEALEVLLSNGWEKQVTANFVGLHPLNILLKKEE